MAENGQKFAQWGVLEIMGHNQVAGWITEETIGGAALIRVDVPENNGWPATTKYYGPSAIYALHPTTEEVARQAAERLGRQGAPLPVATPDLSAAEDTLREAKRAAEWLRTQQQQIAAVLRDAVEQEERRMLMEAGTKPWESSADYHIYDDDDDGRPY